MLKHEKPKLPQFLGDVRKYFIFKANFQHAIESHCSERDTITILRSCLGPEPSKLIEGISTDLKVMWQYLDQNYGDPRIISDTITGDLEKFKPIQGGEDHRFCDLVNLVRRSYNILKEIKRPQDINNSQVISLIERKMTKDDIKVWARHIHVQKLEPPMENLLKWVRSNWLWAVAVSLPLSLFLRHVSCLLTYEFVYIVTYVYIVIYSMFGESNKLN